MGENWHRQGCYLNQLNFEPLPAPGSISDAAHFFRFHSNQLLCPPFGAARRAVEGCLERLFRRGYSTEALLPATVVGVRSAGRVIFRFSGRAYKEMRAILQPLHVVSFPQ